MTLVLSTSGVEETRDLGAVLAEYLEQGTTVLLTGGLGAGKTALSQGIARGLGIGARVTSPTFTMVATYRVDGRRGISTFLHADLYRVGSGAEAEDLALGELVEEGAVAVVEWGDVAPDALGGDQVVISLVVGDGDDDRTLTISDDDRVLDGVALADALSMWIKT